MNNQVQIRLEQTTPLKCKCGNEKFYQVFFLRTVPALLSGTMKPEMLPIPAFECSICGEMANVSQNETRKTG